jgi:predicted metal-dependent peptidase
MSGKTDIEEELSRCIIKLLLKEPFYAHFLSGIVRKITAEIPTAAVGISNGRVTLYVNEDFFMKELPSSSSRVAIIKHETLHILFKHCFRLGYDNYNLQLFNVAADLVVNQFIGNWDLPKSAVTLNSFPGLNLEPNQSVEWYYKKLFDLHNDPKSAPQSSQYLEDILTQKSNGDHSKWGEEAGFSSLHSQLDDMIIQAKERTSSKDYGTVPSDIQRLVSQIVEKRKPQINWKRALQLFSASSRKTRIYHTEKRISNRYGTRPGIKIKRYQKLIVAIDTSGSIQETHFSMFFSEIHTIWKQGAEIEIIECDAQVQRIYNFTGKKPEFMKGGGGTDFDPVFTYIKQNRFKRFDGCIYLTDGYASEPKVVPPCKVFWLLTPEGSADALKFGRVVKFD